MKYCYALALILLSLHSFSQVNPGPRITALGSIGVALQDAWSLQSNQAGIAALKNTVAAVAYENKFFNPELSTKSAVLVYRYQKNAFGLSFQNYGFSAYQEQKLGLSYAKNFGDQLFLALNLNAHQLSISQYGSARAFTAEVGLQYAATDQLLIGAHVANPTNNGYNVDANAVIPVRIELGASYKFSEYLLLNTGVRQTLNANTDAAAGVEYSLAHQVVLRGGVSVNPFCQYAGVGVNCQIFKLDTAVICHPVLGYSPQLALKYDF